MLAYFIPLIVAILTWLGLRLTGNETHAADGIIFFGLVAVEILVIWLGSRKESLNDKARKNLNSMALPLLLAGHLPIGYLLAAAGLLVLAYVAKAAVDTLTHQAGNNVFEKLGAWFDARTSWLNKYKPGSWPAAPRPRFWLSTTALVGLTDFWHAADSVYLTAYLVGGMLLGAWLGPVKLWPWLLAVALVKGLGGALFQGGYRLFRVNK